MTSGPNSFAPTRCGSSGSSSRTRTATSRVVANANRWSTRDRYHHRQDRSGPLLWPRLHLFDADNHYYEATDAYTRHISRPWPSGPCNG